MVLKNYIASLIACSLLAQAADAPLSALKQEQIAIDRHIDEKNAKNLKYDWVNPIVASYTYSVNDQYSQTNNARYFSISLNQPIFKSGGIYFALKYSSATKAFDTLSTSLKEKNLIKALYENVLNLHKIDLQIAKLQYQIASAKIDITRKKEQFEHGLLDSSFLDNAILNKSSLQQLLLDSQSRRFSLLQNFKNISDVDYKSVHLPTFELVSKAEFINKNLDLQSAKAQSRQARYLKNMTISNYLPALALFGEYANRKDSFRLFAQNNESKTYGLKVSMPIFDINRGRTIEIKKLQYLKSKLALQEKQKEAANSFANFKNSIFILKQRRKVAQEDKKLYAGLVHSTKEGMMAGEKTKEDVETMQNSQSIAALDAQIYDVEIQLSFVALYAKMRDEI